MKSVLLLSLLIILVSVDFCTSQKCLYTVLRQDVDCFMPSYYVTGFHRWSLSCCRAPSPQYKAQNCTLIRFRDDLNKYVNHLIIHY